MFQAQTKGGELGAGIGVAEKSIWVKHLRLLEHLGVTVAFSQADANQPTTWDQTTTAADVPGRNPVDGLNLFESKGFAHNAVGQATCRWNSLTP